MMPRGGGGEREDFFFHSPEEKFNPTPAEYPNARPDAPQPKLPVPATKSAVSFSVMLMARSCVSC